MPAPLAYFLTWTTYGTWLPRDERESVDRLHNQLGTPRLPADANLRDHAQSRMTGIAFVLTTEARSLVDTIIRKHCQIRGWTLLALNVRTNHVHVVVRCPPDTPPETAMEQFKAWCTRRLREGKHAEPSQTIWTEHGSTRWMNHEEGLAGAIDYVLNQQ